MIKNKDEYLDFISDEKQIIVMRNLLDKIEIVMRNHTEESTDFLDPYQRRLARSILNRFLDIDYIEEGGILEAERKIIVIYPDYLQKENIESFTMSLCIKGNIDSLSHKDFLGALLGLGINRDKIGDILIHEDETQVVVAKEIGTYILYNFKKVGNQNVKVKEINKKELRTCESDYKEKYITLSSPRIDALVSGAFNISRNESFNCIKRGKVKVNWEPIDKASVEIREGDMISVGGFGRFIIKSFNGVTRKGRIKAVIRILI